jgi:hypothetical protein
MPGVFAVRQRTQPRGGLHQRIIPLRTSAPRLTGPPAARTRSRSDLPSRPHARSCRQANP